jgi:hypothetical protein
MVDAGEIKESEVAPQASKVNEGLQLAESKIDAWVGERSIKSERNARGAIAESFRNDLDRMQKGEEPLPPKTVLGMTEKTRDKLGKLLGTQDSIKVEKTDSETGEKYIAEVRREEGGWVAEERRETDEGVNLISQAQIREGGGTMLTLNPEGERYEERGADLHVSGEPNTPEAAATTFNLLSESIMRDREGVKKFEEERKQKKREQILKDIKDNKNAEGSMLYGAYMQALKDGNLPYFSSLYRRAETAVGSLDEDVEVNKALIAMQGLYKQAELGEYKPGEGLDENLSQEEKIAAVKKRISEDFTLLPEKIAEKKISGFVETQADVALAQEALQQKIESGELSRTQIGKASYDLEEKKVRLLREVDKQTYLMGDDKVGDAIFASFKKKWEFEEKKLDKSFGELEEGKRKKLAGESIALYKDRFDSFKREGEKASSLDLVEEEERYRLFLGIAEADRKITNRRENLENAVMAGPSAISGLVSEIKNLELERDAGLERVKVTIAAGRVEEADKIVSKKRRENALKGVSGGRGKDLRNAVLGWITSKGSKLKQEVTRDLSSAAKSIKDQTDVVGAAGLEAAQVLDEVLVRDVRERIGSFGKEGGVVESARLAAIEAQTQARLLQVDAETSYLQEVHSTHLYLQEQWASFAAAVSGEYLRLNMFTRRKIGGEDEEVQGILDKKEERIKRFMQLGLEKRIEEIKARENPHMAVFTKDLEQRAGLANKFEVLVDVKTEKIEDTENFVENLGVDYQVFKIRKEGEEEKALLWWEDNKLRIGKVDNEGNLLVDEVRYEEYEDEKQRNKLLKKTEKGFKKLGYKVEKGYFFSKGAGGNMELVKERVASETAKEPIEDLGLGREMYWHEVAKVRSPKDTKMQVLYWTDARRNKLYAEYIDPKGKAVSKRYEMDIKAGEEEKAMKDRLKVNFINNNWSVDRGYKYRKDEDGKLILEKVVGAEGGEVETEEKLATPEEVVEEKEENAESTVPEGEKAEMKTEAETKVEDKYALPERLKPENFWDSIDKDEVENHLFQTEEEYLGFDSLLSTISETSEEEKPGITVSVAMNFLDYVDRLPTDKLKIGKLGEEFEQLKKDFESEVLIPLRDMREEFESGSITQEELDERLNELSVSYFPKVQETLLTVQDILRAQFPAETPAEPAEKKGEELEVEIEEELPEMLREAEELTTEEIKKLMQKGLDGAFQAWESFKEGGFSGPGKESYLSALENYQNRLDQYTYKLSKEVLGAPVAREELQSERMETVSELLDRILDIKGRYGKNLKEAEAEDLEDNLKLLRDYESAANELEEILSNK